MHGWGLYDVSSTQNIHLSKKTLNFSRIICGVGCALTLQGKLEVWGLQGKLGYFWYQVSRDEV